MRSKALLLSIALFLGPLTAAPSFADPTLTAKVKAMLAAKYHASFTTIQVATNDDGIVWLSGTAPTADACSLAAQIASDTDGVAAVHNKISVQQLIVGQ